MKMTSRRYTKLCRCLLVGLLVGLGSPTATGCSPTGYALRAAADAVSSAGGGYGQEEDPELIRSAAPFALKTMEQLRQRVPDHKMLPLALASGFTEYTYAFVQQDADRAEDKDIKRSLALGLRARRLYLRARNYALDGLELRHKGMKQALLSPSKEGRAAALSRAVKDDVPLLYWTAASWALAVSTGKDRMDLVGDLPAVEEIMARAAQLDASWDHGSIEEFYISYDATRSAAVGGGPGRAKEHLDRAMQLNGGYRVGPLVSYAEGVLLPQQNKAEFVRILNKVVETNVYSGESGWRSDRLANVINQERARWLLSRVGDLFAE